MKTILQFCIFLLLLNVGFLKAQTGDTIRLCQWYLQKYDTIETEERNTSIKSMINSIHSDILIIQGFNVGGAVSFGRDVIDNGLVEYDAVPYSIPILPSITNESRIYFRKTKLLFDTLIAYQSYGHQDFMVRFVFNNPIITDTFNIFVSVFPEHPNSEENRKELGNYFKSRISGLKTPEMNLDKSVMVGALFFTSPNEIGYKYLTSRQGPIPRVVGDVYKNDWFQDSATYSHLYTNSSRHEKEIGCDSTEGVGVKFRHDFILNSYKLEENYIPNSYTVFGNDGLDRRNSSITDPPNQKVSQEVAEALQCASSHLPVYADYVFGKITSIENLPISELSFSFYPNPLQESSTISCSLPADGFLKITLHDLLGREVAILHDAFKSAGNYTFPFKNENLPDGMYILKMSVGGLSLTKSVSIVR